MSAVVQREQPVYRRKKREAPTIKLDLKSRICLIAASVYGAELMTPIKAVDIAAEIENAADQKVRTMKRSNPVAYGDNRGR